MSGNHRGPYTSDVHAPDDRLPAGAGRRARALAVLAVLLFHGGVGGFSGGYLGVSVFFTLSGFLITTLLIAEHDRTGTYRPPAVLRPAGPAAAAGQRRVPGGDRRHGRGSPTGSTASAAAPRRARGALQVANWVYLAGERSVPGSADAQRRAAPRRSSTTGRWRSRSSSTGSGRWPSSGCCRAGAHPIASRARGRRGDGRVRACAPLIAWCGAPTRPTGRRRPGSARSSSGVLAAFVRRPRGRPARRGGGRATGVVALAVAVVHVPGGGRPGVPRRAAAGRRGRRAADRRAAGARAGLAGRCRWRRWCGSGGSATACTCSTGRCSSSSTRTDGLDGLALLGDPAGDHARRLGRCRYVLIESPIRRATAARAATFGGAWRRPWPSASPPSSSCRRRRRVLDRRLRRRRGGVDRPPPTTPAGAARADLGGPGQTTAGDVSHDHRRAGDERPAPRPATPSRPRPPTRAARPPRPTSTVPPLPALAAAGAHPRHRRLDGRGARQRGDHMGRGQPELAQAESSPRPGCGFVAGGEPASATAPRASTNCDGWVRRSCCPRSSSCAARRRGGDGHVVGRRRPPLDHPTNCSVPTDAECGMHLEADYTDWSTGAPRGRRRHRRRGCASRSPTCAGCTS